MKKYSTIIFDVGDVLMDYRWRAMFLDQGLPEEDVERIGRELFDDPHHIWRQSDLGTATPDDLTRMYSEEYPADSEWFSFFLHHGEYMNIPRPRVWKMIHTLKEDGYRIYLLSNYSKDLFEKHTRYAEFMKDIDGMLVSYMVGLVKPDRAIYEELLRRYALDRGACIFFDDRLDNVEAANADGIHAEQVTGQEMLLGRLRELHEDAVSR